MCPEYDKLCRAHQQPQNTEAVQPFIAHWKEDISTLICLEKKKACEPLLIEKNLTFDVVCYGSTMFERHKTLSSMNSILSNLEGNSVRRALMPPMIHHESSRPQHQVIHLRWLHAVSSNNCNMLSTLRKTELAFMAISLNWKVREGMGRDAFEKNSIIVYQR